MFLYRLRVWTGNCNLPFPLAGRLSRLLLEPPFPCPDVGLSAPFFRDNLPAHPPVLNLCFLSRYVSISLIFVLGLSLSISPFCLIFIPVVYLLMLMYAVAEESSF